MYESITKLLVQNKSVQVYLPSIFGDVIDDADLIDMIASLTEQLEHDLDVDIDFQILDSDWVNISLI